MYFLNGNAVNFVFFRSSSPRLAEKRRVDNTKKAYTYARFQSEHPDGNLIKIQCGIYDIKIISEMITACGGG